MKGWKRKKLDRSAAMRIPTWIPALGLLLCAMPATQARGNASLHAKIRAALSSVPHSRTVSGVCVVDLQSGQTVFEHNADRAMIPASNMKVFVMAAALLELGADFHFETVLAVGEDNLVLIGDGDPGLGDEKICKARGETITSGFDRWADELVARGLTKFSGDLIIDETIFDDQRVHPSWDERDLGKWFSAPVGALNFNDNCVEITVSPGPTDGSPTVATVKPDCSLVEIVNRCITGSGKKKPVVHHPPGTFKYKLSGRCKKRWAFPAVAFPDPGMLAGDSLRTVLAKKGIHVSGSIRRGRVRTERGGLPAGYTEVGRIATSLVEVLRRTGKNSQNLFAECLFKRIGHAWAVRNGATNVVGSWASGALAIEAILRQAGVAGDGLTLADGSGLSRDNRCTARQLTATLVALNAHPHGAVFRDSLSIAGVDGSLRKRLKDLPGRVYGKTGTMRGIRTLSGYVTDGSSPRYAFAVMFNGYKGPSTPYREIQDRICRAMTTAAKPPK